LVAKRRRSSSHFAHKKAICAAVAACFNASATYANPTGPQVVAGQAAFNTQGSLLNVTNAPGTVIHWQRFSIGAGETTRFVQQSAQSAVLNRVITADPSVLLGTLSSNGKVFLINPSGVLVGAGGRVDVAGFVASTLNITNEDFAAGRLRFQPAPNAGSVVNEGVITSPSGGHVYLIAPNVTNAGVITTPKGEAILAAGNQVELLDTGTPGVRVQIDVPGGEARNVGQIVADSGRIGIVGALVQNRGRLSADQVVGDASGRIFLKASKSATLSSGSTTTANGTRGGDIQISGDQGVTVEKDAIVQANGTETGGSILAASSAGAAVIAGSLQATGGSQGGAIRVASGAGGVQIDGQLLASATTGRGGAIALSSDGPLNVTSLSALDASGAAGGTINLSAANGSAAVDGTMDATGTASPGGRIDVIAATDITIGDSGKLRAAGTQGGTVYIEARRDNNTSGTTSLAGLLDVSGHEGEGGKALLLGPRVAILRNGAIEASGTRGGGIALVGGDYQGKNADVPNASATYVGPDTSIKADAIVDGDGGKVIVWSADATRAYGTISARGGAQSGKGGFVETSGHYLDVDGIRVDVSATAGVTGTWLLDPTDLELNNDTSDTNISRTPTFKPSASGAKLRWATIKSNLDSADVSVTTSGTTDSSGETGAVKIKAGTSYNSSHKLSITAASGIDIEAEITNSGNGAVSLTATSGTVNFRANVSTGSNGLNVIAANANFSSGTTKVNGSYSVSGTTTINGGTATFDTNASAPALTLSSGTLGGSGTVSTDNLNWTGGALLGSLTLNSGKTGALSAGAKAIGSSASAATFTNKGTITDSTPGGSASLQLYGSSTFNNQGVYSFTTDAGIDNPNGSGVINNTGSFTKTSGNGTSTISAKFVNAADSTGTGTVKVNNGTLKFSPPSSTSASHAGTFEVASGATLDFSNGTHDVSGTMSGAGDLAVNGGTLNVKGAFSMSGRMSLFAGTTTLAPTNGAMTPASMNVGGGAVKINGDVNTPTFAFTSGTLGGSGILTVSNAFSRSGGTMDGTLGGLDVTQGTGDLAPGIFAVTGNVSLATKAGGLKLDSLSGTKIVGKATGGDLTLNQGSAITASGSSDALVLVSGGNFVNNAGGSAMSAPNGRWLVYSKDPTLDTRGALAYDFKQYGATYDGTAYSGQGKGNGFLYSIAPTLTASLVGSASKTYDGTTAAVLATGNFATAGALDGDTVSYDTSVAPAYADKNVGSGKTVSTTISLAGAANGAAKVYGYQMSKGNISGGIGKIEKANLTFTATAADKVYDATTAATISLGDNRVRNDVLTINYSSASFGDKNVGKAKTVTIAGIALAGTDAGNYSYDATASAKADITQASATISGLTANNKVYDALTAATVNSAAATVKGVFTGDAVTLVGGTASFADKNVGTAKAVTAKGFSLGGADAANYALTQPSGLTADITPASLTATGLTATGKVYDGTATATLSGGTLSGVLGNDVVRAALSGAFSDKNAGSAKSVKAGAVLSGPDATNYTFVSPSGISADITPKALSTWVGSAGGLWSDSANWDHGIVPDASNVIAVSIPALRDGVVYDASAGNTTLRTLDSGLSVVLKGGILTLGAASADISTIRSGATLELQSGANLFVNGALNAAAYVQSGGALAGTGSLTVSSKFAQTGGTIVLTGAGSAALSQATGNLSVGSLAAPMVTLAALNGAIGQSAALAASTLSATAANGITLTNAANKIGSFTAKNTGSGNLMLTNSIPLSIPSLTDSGGNITIDNVGAVTTFGEVTAPAGAVTITTHSPLAIGAGGIFASGDIVLSAGQTAGSGDNLNVSGIVSSTAKGSAITLSAGDDLFQNANVTSNGGNVTASAQTGNISMALGAATTSAGGTVAYAAPAGSIALTRLDADSGAIAVTSGINMTSTSAHTGANLVGKSAIITSGGNAILSTNVQQLQTRVSGTYSVLDVVTGNVTTNVPTTSAPLQQAEQSIVTAVISSTKTTASTAASTVTGSTLTPTTTSNGATTGSGASTSGQSSSSSNTPTAAAASAATSTTAGALGSAGTGSSALPIKTDPNGTIGGAPNEFGGTQLASVSAPTKTAAADASTSGSAGESSTKTEGGQRGESKDGPQQKRVAQAAEKRSEAKSATKKAAVCR